MDSGRSCGIRCEWMAGSFAGAEDPAGGDRGDSGAGGDRVDGGVSREVLPTDRAVKLRAEWRTRVIEFEATRGFDD